MVLGYIDYEMDNLIKILSINSFWKIVFDPLIELNQEIEDIHRDRHRTRSIIKIIIALTAGAMSVYYSLNNITIMEMLAIFTEILNFSKESKPFFTSIIDIVLCCHIGMWCGGVSTRTFCKYYYGDPEFYLPPDKLALLEQKLKLHIENITQQEILDVVNFCIHKFNKENSQALGTKKEDWKRILESLIYDANMEAFYEQQEALYARNEKINNTVQRILFKQNTNNQPELMADYGSIADKEPELPRTFTLIPQQPRVQPDQSENGMEIQEYLPKITLTLPAFAHFTNSTNQENHSSTSNYQEYILIKTPRSRKSI